MTDPAINNGSVRLRDVIKNYTQGHRRVEALRGVDLDITEPGFYAIMGPSGSGKSTLLHLMAALDRPDRGTISVSGCDIHEMSEKDLTLFRRRKIGIVFQQFNLIPTLSAIDNVALPGMLDGMSRSERLDRSRDLINRLGVADRASHRPDALSGGEQQRIAIARSLLFEPAVLFADEPTGNLDSATSEHVWQLLKSLAVERNLTVLMVTHEPEAAVHCRRVFVLRDGRIATSFETEGLNVLELATRAQHAGR